MLTPENMIFTETSNAITNSHQTRHLYPQQRKQTPQPRHAAHHCIPPHSACFSITPFNLLGDTRCSTILWTGDLFARFVFTFPNAPLSGKGCFLWAVPAKIALKGLRMQLLWVKPPRDSEQRLLCGACVPTTGAAPLGIPPFQKNSARNRRRRREKKSGAGVVGIPR